MSSQSRPRSSTLAERLGDIVGPERVGDGAAIAIHGLRAPLQVRPADVGQLAATLALADSERLAVCIAGGATKLGWGLRPERLDLLVSTRDLRSPCAVDADDLTMTVGAGVTVAEARAQARSLDRVFPLDGSRPELATAGGVIATGDQGPRAAGYGRVRDQVLGLKATLADGTPVAFGGRTVKNVAGYDMAKLFVGSFGSFGVITEVTFRLLPRPEAQCLLTVPLASLAQGESLAAEIMGSCLQPLVLEVLCPHLAASLRAAFPSLPVAAGEGPLFLAGFAGHPAALARSLADVSGWAGVSAATSLSDAQAEAVFDALPGLTAAGTLTARASVPISEAWGLAQTAESLATAADLALTYRIGAACGTVDLQLGPQGPSQPDSGSLAAWVTALRGAAVSCGGRLAVTDRPALPGVHMDVWGDLGPQIRIARRIKDRLDPHHTLNPGMAAGGI